MNSCYAFLSNKDGFTVFKYGNYVIRFKAPYSLEKYMEVKQWDDGYLVVMAKYHHNQEMEEVVEPGDFKVYVGRSSEDYEVVEFTVK